MKKRILSILLLCCMVLTMMPATVFAADGEVAARASETGGLFEHHPEHDETCGADPAGASDTMMPKTRSGAVRPAATQYTYTLHYDANGGSGAPPSQSVISSEFHVWVPISDKIPTRDGYTFMGWANSRTGKPIYGGNGGYTECLVVHGYDMSTTIYAIWEVHNHSWGEWTSNGNGTHTRICTADSSHTETGNCSGGKATSTEKAVCETCHTAYGELLQPAKTVITTPPTLSLPAYVGNEYTDRALRGGEAKAESTGVVVPGTFSFRDYEGGRVYPGKNRMVILFTPNDTEAYTTAECTLIVMGTKRKVTRVPDDVIITNKPIGTAFENLGLPSGVKVETNTGASYSPVPVTWNGSTYDPNKYGEQIITGELHVEKSGFTDGLEPTNTVKATARITLIDDRVFTPTLEPPTYSKQLYGGDLCFLVFADKYLSGGAATVNGETVSGKFTLDKDQKIYGHSLTASTLLQAGQLKLKVIFTPDNLRRYNKAECTVDVNVVPRTFKETRAGHITNEKFGTPFEELNLSDSFSFYAVGDEKDPEGTGMDFGMNVVTSWDSSTYDPNSFEEQTIYGEVNRAELEKYFTIPDGTDLRAVRKVQLQPDPAETEITQLPVFRWKNGDFTLPDNTIFTWRKLQVGTYNDEVGTLVGGVAKVKGTDTVAPGTFSFKNTPPFYLRTPGEHDVTVVFTPDDLRLHKPTEITIKINAVKNTIKDIDEPDPITDKPFGTPFAELGLPEDVCINAVDGAWCWIDVTWNESSYDAESVDWQTIIGTLVLSEDDGDIFQQPEPAVTAAIRVKLIDNRPPMPPTIVAESLPDGMEGEAYSNRLTAKGTAPITWSIVSGALPEGLSLNEDTGEISGTPAGEGTEVFTVMAVNDLGEDIKELSITIVKAPEAEYAVTVRDDGHGTGSADPASATAGTEITLTATPNAGYHFKEWQVMSGDVTVRDDKFTMPGSDVEVKAIFEEDAPPTPTEYTVTFDGNDGTPSVGSMTTTKQKLTSLPDASRSKHSFNGWYTEKSGGTKITTDTVFSANTTVYAHWTHTGDNNPPVNYYTLRFETGGGSAIPGVRETYNTYIDLTKYVPTRHGYTFVGWYSEQSLVNKVSDIYLTGDRTVYAGWRAVTIPQTGDSGQMNLWSTALCASFAGCVALIVWKIRRREKKSL
ncbi:InlB B-repeat-containing protein [Hominenteromicrobium sp.]|uniref:InlB B-repeat-containing protein n=1 Tax=Hominenteromicrobium sp. TaxID=3073581 RepID=UPI003AF7DC4B